MADALNECYALDLVLNVMTRKADMLVPRQH